MSHEREQEKETNRLRKQFVAGETLQSAPMAGECPKCHQPYALGKHFCYNSVLNEEVMSIETTGRPTATNTIAETGAAHPSKHAETPQPASEPKKTHNASWRAGYAAGRLAQREEDAQIAENTTVTASGYYAGLYESGGEHCAEKIARAIREAGETEEAK